MDSIEDMDTMSIMYACPCVKHEVEIEYRRVDYPHSHIAILNDNGMLSFTPSVCCLP